MKSIKKRTIAFVLLTVLSVQGVFTGCAKKSETSVKLWSTYSTVKVMQDKHDYEEFPARIEVFLAKGETESAQLLITAETDVRDYELIPSPIKTAEGDTFKSENVDIEVQKYIEIVQKTAGQTNDAYPLGMVPDMLLPMSIAKKYGENSIDKGYNQGLTIEFTADTDTAPGTYTGTYELIVDEKNYGIPVSVTVWDVDVSKAYGKTAVSIVASMLAAGEKDNTGQMYKVYYDTLLNRYKTCAALLPGSYSVEGLLTSLNEYWDNPNFTTFTIPMTLDWWINSDMLTSYVYALAKNSTPDRIYLDRAVLFPIDEPTISEDSFDKINVIKLQVQQVRETVWNRLEEEGFFENYGGIESEFAIKIKKSLQFPSIITSSDIDEWGDSIETYCPPIQYYNSSVGLDKFKVHAENGGYEQWYYTCLQPIYPYPSHHIDDYLVGSRIMRWMQKAYDLDGYLYWCSNQYVQTGDSDEKVLIDPYESAGRFWYSGGVYNGDGYLFYPGIKYGVDGPLGSLRLDALRDGQEDLNLLNVYENALISVKDFYGLGDVDGEAVLNEAYSELFGGTIYNENGDAALIKYRKNIAEKIALLSGESKFYYRTVKTSGSQGKIEFYAAPGYDLFIGNEKLTAQKSNMGNVFVYEYDKTQGLDITATLKAGGETVVSASIVNGTEIGVNAATLLENVKLSEGSSARETENGIEANLVSRGDDIIEMMSFKPTVTIKTGAFAIAFDKIEKITFNIECVNADAGLMEIYLASDSGTILLDSYMININQKNSIELNVADAVKKSGNILGIRLVFKNMKNDTELYGIRSLLITELTYGGERN